MWYLAGVVLIRTLVRRGSRRSITANNDDVLPNVAGIVYESPGPVSTGVQITRSLFSAQIPDLRYSSEKQNPFLYRNCAFRLLFIYPPRPNMNGLVIFCFKDRLIVFRFYPYPIVYWLADVTVMRPY